MLLEGDFRHITDWQRHDENFESHAYDICIDITNDGYSNYVRYFHPCNNGKFVFYDTDARAILVISKRYYVHIPKSRGMSYDSSS